QRRREKTFSAADFGKRRWAGHSYRDAIVHEQYGAQNRHHSGKRGGIAIDQRHRGEDRATRDHRTQGQAEKGRMGGCAVAGFGRIAQYFTEGGVICFAHVGTVQSGSREKCGWGPEKIRKYDYFRRFSEASTEERVGVA